MKPWVQRFNPYDLYSKDPNRPKLEEAKLCNDDLLTKHLSAEFAFKSGGTMESAGYAKDTSDSSPTSVGVRNIFK